MRKFAKINIDEKKLCWWCSQASLTGEHKFKKTDLDKIYGKGEVFKQLGISVIDYRSNTTPKKLQSSKSNFAKFEKSLCQNCNNAKSQKADFAYDKMIDYYLNNEGAIKNSGIIDFTKVYGTDWRLEKLNLYRYIMKHIGCRMFENNLRPFDGTIKYLDGDSNHNHLKVVIQIKPYNLLGIDTLYKSPFIPIVTNKILNDVFAVCGWFTMKNLSFNYLYEWNIDQEKSEESNSLCIDITDYSGFDSIFEINETTMAKDYGRIIEALEFYPFIAQKEELEIYNYLKKK